MTALPTDENLLAACARGDSEAFGRLAGRYGSVLDAYFRRRLPDDGRVEELRQETLLALYSLMPSYRERGRFRSLVFTIAHRKLASELRARLSSGAVRVAPSDDLPSREREAAGAIDLRSALSKLPEPLREALMLTVFEGLSSADAGEVLGCSAEALRARVCRAKSALAHALDPDLRRKS